jgi:2-polyprenyl-3-methyl-5-hydroxy-6-metoxy-1,4-benzoquinol methylase
MKNTLKIVHGALFNLAMPVLSQPPGRMFRGKFETFHRVNIIQFLERWAPEVSGEVLDVGGGTWTFPRKLLQNQCHYVCVDNFSHQNVDVVCDIYQLNSAFENESFDYVLCTDVLEHLARPWEAVERIHAGLKPGGRLLLTTPFFYRFHPSQVSLDYWRATEQGLSALLLETVGFREVEVQKYGHPRLPYTLTAVAVK